MLGQQLFAIFFDQSRIQVGGGKRCVSHEPAQKRQIGAHANNMGLRQRRMHARNGLFPIFTPDNELGDHGIVIGRDGITLAYATIDANRAVAKADMLGQAKMAERADGRQKAVVWILRVNPRFNGMTFHGQLRLRQGQGLASGDTQLPLDQIQPGNHFGDRMLHLQAGIHFHEVEATVGLCDELDRAGAHIAYGLGSSDCRLTHLLAAFRGHARRRGLFNHFLVTTLNRAVTLEQVYGVAWLSANTWISIWRGLVR